MTLTDYVLMGATLFLLAYEMWTIVNKTKGDTISEAFWNVSTKRPLIPFAMGFLMGHFFWQAAK